MREASSTVVITGIGVASPYGVGLEPLEAGLLASECRLAPLARFSPGFAATVAEYTGELPATCHAKRWLSRSDRLAIAAARDAVGADEVRECGVVMATTVAGLSELELQLVADPARWYRAAGLERAASYPVASVAEAVGDAVGARGPRCAVNVACASGAMAIALAAQMCLDGAAPAMLAGGSDALCEFTLSGFRALQALDPQPCRPFDVDRRGLNIGEGAAVLRLETLERAQARHAPVLAVLRGWAMTNDGYHLTAPHEQGRGLATCMLEAMHAASAEPDEIGYVNAHGTGTPLNDVAESKAYATAFSARRQPVPVSSTKSHFGHCLGAAGALEAVVTVIAIRRGALFPTLRLANPVECPRVDWLKGRPRHQSMAAAMSVSAGFGGSNAALVFGVHTA
ncbi:MAG: beta-ketoacyl-[acyl-carrier-protein] synthase family protein [Bryobacteraceae bacterium]